MTLLEMWYSYQACEPELAKTLSHPAAGISNKCLSLAIKVELTMVKSAKKKKAYTLSPLWDLISAHLLPTPRSAQCIRSNILTELSVKNI